MWELPSVTVWLFAAGGIALARPPGVPDTRLVAPPRLARVIAAIVVLALAVTPVLNALADARLRDSVAAFKVGDCQTAIDQALSATSALGARPEPYAILAFCDVRIGKLELADRMIRNAVDRDPGNWVYHYGLAWSSPHRARIRGRPSPRRAGSTRASRGRSRPRRPSAPRTTPKNGKGGP